jgi:hypothetical protein
MAPVQSIMRVLLVLCGLILCSATSVLADSRVFIIANQPDGYGVDKCLADGAKCGASAAQTYCQGKDFARATAFRRVDPEEITGAVPVTAGNRCGRSGCDEYVAITCQR